MNVICRSQVNNPILVVYRSRVNDPIDKTFNHWHMRLETTLLTTWHLGCHDLLEMLICRGSVSQPVSFTYPNTCSPWQQQRQVTRGCLETFTCSPYLWYPQCAHTDIFYIYRKYHVSYNCWLLNSCLMAYQLLWIIQCQILFIYNL